MKLQLKIRSVIAITALFTLLGCAETIIKDPPIKDPEARVFYDGYEQVWRSIQLALRKYPVKINNIDSGILETEYVNGDKLFAEPNETKARPSLRYKIVIRVVKGKLGGKQASKVSVLKSSESQPDFFSGYQPVPSNGLEEAGILYRIARYLEIDHLLSKTPAAPPKAN